MVSGAYKYITFQDKCLHYKLLVPKSILNKYLKIDYSIDLHAVPGVIKAKIHTKKYNIIMVSLSVSLLSRLVLVGITGICLVALYHYKRWYTIG